MEEISTENYPQSSNLMSFNAEQLGQLPDGDKTDKVSNSASQTDDRFSFDVDSVNAAAEEEEGEPVSPIESDPMEVPNILKPRERRVSDVIDSIGDCLPDINATKMVSSPDRGPGTQGPNSPASSGYGSIESGTPKSVVSPDLDISLSSPIKFLKVDVTDALSTATDASPMNQDDGTSSSEPAGAVMPVEKYAEEYNMKHKRRGKAVIFSHDKFADKSVPSRDGSHADIHSLEITYKALGFEVTTYDNLLHTEIRNVINSLAEEDHSDADCVMVTVLTHGQGTNYLHAKDVLYNVDMLWSPFTADSCGTLAGKPKIFIIQACRGDKLDPGVRLKQRSRTETDSISSSYKIPTHADFLIAYSSVEGYYSWRNPDEGTWFIQCLCKELQEQAATRDLLNILTRTSRRVAVDHESYNDKVPWQHQQKQVPSFNSMLIRDLYFRPKI
ncbi:caspase-1-like isoform X1 [Zootermopsis nevadensis]|uniref:caspase-1-like isoform X1 n=1 Tax=Zootermopsis nevadensis TaxID=136037 RepID=UPI000B8E2502|nr:caspase-1-like isoform X1 [Zootermopsis nevadensis]XP_021935873.1 caspase-1-like isoform X1 [Zootermopsis nevadensis]XP_021935874.1 caspase-1-like isoform X1 [Zootermopsis nevadensis]XP_021935875.1 caspase-1-like isoform X1 [Zootermopsis nevadensis]XP_021935876.1 caspase-1-like isoform X1 [Zootermopsis nevadensis]XP_021935877.1 caspase-1-like isoform X1 [Zootermopsis nevadensis]XP_021935878.1 caspase-1-like isoform X1 [Zootermopsis nevadensis]